MKNFSILFLTIIIGCNGPTKTEKTKTSNINPTNDTIKTFQEYVEKMPFIQLPVLITCNEPYFENFEKFRNNDFGAGFKPEGATIIGKIKVTHQFVAIVYSHPSDIALPILETYNLKGEKIDQLQLVNIINCAEDFTDTIEANSSLIISQDTIIQIIDSIFRTVVENDITTRISLKSTFSETFRISESGKIIN